MVYNIGWKRGSRDNLDNLLTFRYNDITIEKFH